MQSIEKRRWWACLATAALVFSVGCGGGEEPLEPEPDEELSGGTTTVFDVTDNAFGLSLRNLPVTGRDAFFVGNSFFKDNWVTAPASTDGRDGLGPVFNARSCSTCHFKDGRGQPPQTAEQPMDSMLLRLSVPGTDAHGGPRPDPVYGDQLQHASIEGVPGEGRTRLTYTEVSGRFEDGETYTLRRPSFEIFGLAFGPLAADILVSPRVAPSIVGLGLLEAVPESDIISRADPDDRDGDGISGRPNRVWDPRRQAIVLGRFGWKANTATLEQQNAAAFLGDIGITTSLLPQQNCTDAQVNCRRATTGGNPEASDHILSRLTFYTQALAVPARRNWDTQEVLRGKSLFAEARCTACHTPKVQTGAFPEVPELGNQTIRPYTDLLLHDMGEDLADGRPDFVATGREWRTPPLWGLGLIRTVNGHTTFLHDGRARNVMEAVLWHGGEAQASRDAVLGFTREERQALILFLESL